ncbi:PT domain-containing protein [Micromonospora sp. PLK6-60]|uniref:PT domain-containing protein n=1 Tax=Micromonospora sp. PLK6-60 TaxID=2873383 RepID=UPI001CA7441E|nr:PT domain-containing protein [Micromonospora sp. PLK6-60]MBY8871267.1 PT domain-containing protein [Micromonospora sp. PLK6-60]
MAGTAHSVFGADDRREDEAVVRVRRYALRVGLVLAGVLVAGLGGALPAGAAPGFATELSGLPDEFTAGDRVQTVAAVVSRTGRGGGCLKVRWSLVLSVNGIRLDQVKLDRVEDDGSFPVDVRTEGDTARLTDRRLDPGTLCPDRTVTARYRVAFAEDVGRGRISLAAEAYDEGLRLLARQTATRNVVGAGAAVQPAPPTVEPTVEPAEPTVEPTAEPEAAPTVEPTDDSATAGAPVAQAPPPGAEPGRRVAESGGFGVVQAAFLLGGLLLFLGVGLLLRLRHLTRTDRAAREWAESGTARGWESPGRPWERAPATRPWRTARR